jgi:hypothetical protein
MLSPFFVGCAQTVPVENRNSLIIHSVLSCKGDGFTPAILEGTEPLPIVKTEKWGVFGAWFEKPVLGLGKWVG